MRKLVVVRKDLLEQGISVPVGNDYYGEKEPLEYKWRLDEFYVFYKGFWEEASSIDFEFLN
jgi:hypothetical protein